LTALCTTYFGHPQKKLDVSKQLDLTNMTRKQFRWQQGTHMHNKGSDGRTDAWQKVQNASNNREAVTMKD